MADKFYQKSIWEIIESTIDLNDPEIRAAIDAQGQKLADAVEQQMIENFNGCYTENYWFNDGLTGGQNGKA